MTTKRKKYIRIAIAILFVGVALWSYTRWDVWFGNPPEAPYTASKTPSRVLLTFGNEGELSRMVSWMCGDKVDENAVLLLADSTDTVRVKAIVEVFESRAGKAAYYRAELKGLKAEHTYSYAVETNGALSKWYSFTTSNPKSESFSFLYMGDVQDTINGVANILLKKAITRHPEVEFVVFGGDLIERPTDAYFAETFRSIDSVCTAMPIVNVTGNHDYLKYLIRKCERRFALTFPYFLKGMEERNDENHLFTFTYHNTQFFLLDTDRGMYYLNQQRIWLKEQMEKCRSVHKIVVVHHPLYSVKKKNNNIDVRWMFNDIITDARTKLVLQGHEHSYARCTNDEKPLKGHICVKGPLYTVSHCSPKNYEPHPTERFYPVKNGSRYYQIVHVTPNSVNMQAFDAFTGELIDSVNIFN